MTNTEINTIPPYLKNDYLKFRDLYEIQIKSKNPENNSKFTQELLDILIKKPSSFAHLSNQIAFAIYFVVKIDSSKMNQFDINSLPTWKKLSPCFTIDKNYQSMVEQLQKRSQYELKIAILLIHIHQNME